MIGDGSALLADLHRTGNLIEAGFWILVSAVFAFYALRGERRWRRECWGAALAFAAFALTDLIEVRTGHWARPWQLFVSKAACVAAFAGLLLHYLKQSRGDA